MVYEVIGLEDVNYISKKTGKPVTGKKLHLTYDSEKVLGCAVESVFVNKEVYEDVKAGDKIELFYNKFGQVDKMYIS